MIESEVALDATTTVVAAPMVPKDEFLAMIVRQYTQVHQWASSQVFEPLQKLGAALLKQLEEILTPHMERLRELVAPHLKQLEEATAPHIKTLVAYQERAVAACEPYVVKAHEGLAIMTKQLEPHVQRTYKAVAEASAAATAQLKVHGGLVKQKSEAWLSEQHDAGSKAFIKWQAQLQTTVARHLALSKQVWGGALAGAISAHRSAQAVHEIHGRTAAALKEKAASLREEDFDRAKLAKQAELRLAELATKAEELVYLKACALESFDYSSAHGYQCEFDTVVADSEAELKAVTDTPLLALSSAPAPAPPVTASVEDEIAAEVVVEALEAAAAAVEAEEEEEEEVMPVTAPATDAAVGGVETKVAEAIAAPMAKNGSSSKIAMEEMAVVD